MVEVRVYFNGEQHLEPLLIEEHRLRDKESISEEVTDEFEYWDYWVVNAGGNVIQEFNTHEE